MNNKVKILAKSKQYVCSIVAAAHWCTDFPENTQNLDVFKAEKKEYLCRSLVNVLAEEW